MTDKPPPEENDDRRQENEQQDRSPEPEGGPGRRAQAFSEERFSQLKPRTDTDEESPTPPGTPTPTDEQEPPLPPTFRQDLIRRYRERQSQQIDFERPPSIRDEESDEDADTENTPPEQLQPPPANNWIPIGPSVLRQGQGGVTPPTSGRTPAIAVAPSGTRIYIGAANGGVWRSEDTGRTWHSLMEAFDLNPTNRASDSLACGAIGLVHGASASQDRLYIGTGEAHGGSGAMFGVGPVFSNDGGANWNTEATSPASNRLAGSGFYALAVDPADPDRVVGATRLGVYRREPDGLGNYHWDQKTLPGAGSARATSVVVARSGNTTTFYAASQNGPVYSSTDGDTWVVVGTGFPNGVGRVSLAVQSNNPTIVYAFTSDGRVLRLDTNDGNWNQITGIPNANVLVGSQGWYDLAIAVAPNNVNRIYIGGSTVWSNVDWSGSLYRCEISVTTSGGSITSISATNTYIGGSIHADVHTIVFAPNDANKLWVGCDGGVFYSTNPTGTGNIFESRNVGLATLTMNYLGQHPTEDAVLFCGTQDNGGVRFTGEEAWLYSSGGDGGFQIINWNDPYKILSTYTGGSIRRSTDGGKRYSYSGVNVPLATTESVLFYAPIAGTPPNPGSPSESDIVAFGSIRPWLSTSFGGGWQSIPNGTLAGDSLNGNIKSLAFASATQLYAGTMNGGVYRFDKSGTSWTRTRIDSDDDNDNIPSNNLPLAGVVTDIAVDSADASGNSIYITFGGTGDYRHVWHFNGTQWTQRSGPSADNQNSLLDVQHNAIVVDPANTTHIYVGADIGVWHSTDGGTNWAPFSHGLPDAAVLDLKLHAGRRLLRAATHGRSVYERTLDNVPKRGIDLYIRDTQLDQGRFTTINGLADPTEKGETVRHWRSPDIKLDTPDSNGQYQFPLTGTINFHDFVDTLTDDFRNVATHASSTITTRVYVQVHNRGVIPANNVQVMLLLANASAGLPALPSGYENDVQNGVHINNADWQTIGVETLNDVRVGAPKIASFNLTSDKLPPPANLTGNDHHCVLALIHHDADPYISTETHTDTNSRQERKAAHKNLKVVQFVGTVPPVAPVVVPIRLNNANLEEHQLTSLLIKLYGYPGRVRLFVPSLEIEGDIEEVIQGLEPADDFEDFRWWAEFQIDLIERNQREEFAFNSVWSEQRIGDIHRALERDMMFFITNHEEDASIRHIIMEPRRYHTIFLLFDRPDAEEGQSFDIEVMQIDDESEELLGTMSTRIEVVPEP